MADQPERTTLPHALSGQRIELEDPAAGRVSFYRAGLTDPGLAGSGSAMNPMLLIHSVNASASAHEVRPLFEYYKQSRPVYAMDLPGFGFSDRSEREYLPQLMVDAIFAMDSHIRSECGDRRVDALAVSLACEFLARAANQRPRLFRSLALVSSTGFRRGTPSDAEPGSTMGRPGVLRGLNKRFVGRPLFRALTTEASIRFFLKKTWGRKEIDEQMFRDSCAMAKHPESHNAPFYFISGFLFSKDTRALMDGLTEPVWLSHGVRGDFTDFTLAAEYADRANWKITEFQTGALPYFEVPEAFCAEYDDFLRDAGRQRSTERSDGIGRGPAGSADDRATA